MYCIITDRSLSYRVRYHVHKKNLRCLPNESDWLVFCIYFYVDPSLMERISNNYSHSTHPLFSRTFITAKQSLPHSCPNSCTDQLLFSFSALVHSLRSLRRRKARSNGLNNLHRHETIDFQKPRHVSPTRKPHNARP